MASIGNEKRMIKMASYLEEQRSSPGPASYLDVQSVQCDPERMKTINVSELVSIKTTARMNMYNSQSLGTIE
jgi:hypothetical protein